MGHGRLGRAEGARRMEKQGVQERKLLSGLNDTEEEDERNERITSRTQRAKSTFFTRSGCSSVLIPTREKERGGPLVLFTLGARGNGSPARTPDNLRRGVIAAPANKVIFPLTLVTRRALALQLHP